VWAANQGQVRLDGASLDQWPSLRRGSFIGYMPQIVDLFPGTISENIARLNQGADDAAIVAAAKHAARVAALPEFDDDEIPF
jgi:ABC-type protease/lipase transport system fused ATPase/permease subunit